MLHSRPSSSDAFQGSSQQYPQSPRMGQQSRSMYNGQNTGYRGTSAGPVQPYAFQSTPHLRQETRTVSAPSTSHGAVGSHRHAHTQSASASSTTSSDTSSQPSAKDDSVMGSRNGSLINLSSSVPDLSLTSFDSPAKASPDRYRRPGTKRVESGNVTPKAAPPQLGASYFSAGASAASASTQQAPLQRQGSVDDMAVSSKSDTPARYRRRSLNNLDTSAIQAAANGQRPSDNQSQSGLEPSATFTPTTIRPVSFHERQASNESQSSQRRKDSALQENAKSSASLHPEQKGVHIPPRTSSEAKTRMKSPSPLSKEAVDPDNPTPHASPQKPKTYAAVAQAAVTTPSPAAAQLAAVSDKDLNKGMKSRLRRAFSFGSAQELKRAGVDTGNNTPAAQQQQQPQPTSAQQAREQHQQHIDEELDAEQQEIARRQEAAGIGAGIYSGQGGFIGSTDNLSISSTASSASMMLRKMGRGAKKSARSIKGLFRPKSVIGVPAADGPVATSSATVQPSVAQVSMVTVEAERQKVNVNEHPGDKPHGITGFPKLERNSMDAVNGVSGSRASADGSDSHSRRSIVGSDRDRAEVLAAVKKGILKRTGTNSPSSSPTIKPTDAAGQTPTIISESPASSMPSTPKDGQSRNDSLKNVTNGDYFSQRLHTFTKSMPATPNGTVRSISFSPRIQFHDAWSSSEYDRRGEIATCNRLTPMLAQQIKEELNTFKMEMEVHESSKPHTHFF
ncbi:hypothetical protein M409DRAFT_67447 [Zasmidium cellare ATCC 36951]|uniref:Protein BNI4 n=1 Tax=Zasmidium cellare ATCC 36951 TaxID=1080233 RepID=A0A6A6CEV3_ZASCE|nr:uncharacterized protein M409DRAFT_67447 [Zasmidium cellare ATCC 36951]KAF2165183.1 hypothetical protein M409DRAFT_67447 [Zasmidium cellare ATCC 36951]